MRRLLMVGSCWNDRVNTTSGQPRAQRVAIIAPIGDQSLRAFAGPTGLARAPDGGRVQGCFQEGDLRRGCRAQVCSQPSTRAIDQNPPLCALAALGLADLGPPFWARAMLPSAKHSSCAAFPGHSARPRRLARRTMETWSTARLFVDRHLMLQDGELQVQCQHDQKNAARNASKAQTTGDISVALLHGDRDQQGVRSQSCGDREKHTKQR
jgi:hypothetical protein